MLNAVFVGNTPSDFKTAETGLNQTFDAVTAFVGQQTWSDYDAGWEISQMKASGAGAVLWSIPLFANTGNLATAATGAYDAYYLKDAQELAASQPNGPIYVRTGWEFNGNWFHWSAQTDPTDYVAAFRQFVDTYRQVSNRFVFTWNPNVGAGGMSDVSAAYPGDAYVDVIGVDIYDNNTFGSNPAKQFQTDLTEPYGLQWLANFARVHNKPLAIPEWGVNGDNDGQFINLLHNWMVQNNVTYQSYWDSNSGISAQLHTGALPTAQAAYEAAFAPPPVQTQAQIQAQAQAAPVHTQHHSLDFDGDGQADILWRNANGAVALWESSRGLGTAYTVTLNTVSPDWQIAGTGDFDGDGKADILWRNTTTGSVALWESTKGLDNAHVVFLDTVSLDWRIDGVGDFDGDGKSDILWRNTTTGDTQLWESSRGLAIAHTVDLGVVSTNLQIAGVGDFDGDGKADILWRNTTTGDIQLWESSKGLDTPHAIDLGVVSTGWQIAGVADFDGDGKADILWRNASTGDTQLWESSKGLNGAHAIDLGNAAKNWEVAGVADYDGDHKADILWHDTTTNQYVLWESSLGMNVQNSISPGYVGGGWSIATHHYDVI